MNSGHLRGWEGEDRGIGREGRKREDRGIPQEGQGNEEGRTGEQAALVFLGEEKRHQLRVCSSLDTGGAPP